MSMEMEMPRHVERIDAHLDAERETVMGLMYEMTAVVYHFLTFYKVLYIYVTKGHVRFHELH